MKPRRAKIIATLGPASESEAVLRRMIQAGMNVARLNFSHGSHEQHAARIARVRAIAHRLGKPVAILQDLQGPKIRTGELQNGQITLQNGDRLLLTTEPIQGTAERISVDYADLPSIVRKGNHILLADGQLELEVEAVHGTEVETRVILGGVLTPHKGVNLPGVPLDIPGFTPKDEADLKFGLQQGVDAIAISFVRAASDIARVRQAIARFAPDRLHTPIIAKLERPEALENLHEIVHAADGVMVARGDLGVEMPPESVPIAQKRIIEEANRHAKIVITATQMLESMIYNPRPTRAEASDVANAIFDGTDAVMLSGETAVGKYPIKAVEMMASVVQQAEAHLDSWGHWQGAAPDDAHDDAVYITRAAHELAHDRNVAAIAVFTVRGRTARLMSKQRPAVPILAFTPDEHTYRQMGMLWGVFPHLVPRANTMETMLAHVENAMIAETALEAGQQVVLICGYPVGTMRPTNLALLHTIGG
ncbi:MAG: pyruvate kinase [Anaerolineae bacterium]|nr:MAG: pyruvate kinase [Anaerolineae bacterium]